MLRRILCFVCAALAFSLFGCDPEATYFVEPRDSELNAVYVSVPENGSQGADTNRLRSVAGNIDSVRYRLQARHAPFLLRGDLGDGTGLDAIQLPALGDADELVVDVPNADWTSLRVYDRGLCSILVSWDDEGDVGSMTNLLYGAILEQFAGTEGVVGAQLKYGRLTPRLQAVMPRDPISSPVARDALLLSFELNAVNIGGPLGLINCNDAVASVEMELELEPSNLAWVEVRGRDGDRRGNDRNFAAQCLGDRRASMTEVRAAVAARTCLPGAELELAEFGTVLASEVGDLRMRADYSGDPDDQSVLVGIDTINGRSVGGNDALVRVRSLDVEFDASCIRARRATIRDTLIQSFRRSFVVGLSDGFRDALVFDPIHIVERPSDLQLIQCSSDADCGARNGQPAFAGRDGSWRGVRHRCLPRDPSRYPDLLSIFVRPPLERVCHPVIEPDHVNIRPDGLQLVVSTSADDVQSAMLTGGAPLSTALCDDSPFLLPLRGHLPPLDPPRPHVDRSPYEYTGPRIGGGIVVGGCAAQEGRGSNAVWLLCLGWLILFRRR